MMFKKMVLTLLLCSVATLAIVACGGTGNSTSTPASATDKSGSRNEVHMSAQDFVQSSLTMSKVSCSPTRIPAKAEAQSATLSVRAASVRIAGRRAGCGCVAKGEWVIRFPLLFQRTHMADGA